MFNPPPPSQNPFQSSFNQPLPFGNAPPATPPNTGLPTSGLATGFVMTPNPSTVPTAAAANGKVPLRIKGFRLPALPWLLYGTLLLVVVGLLNWLSYPLTHGEDLGLLGQQWLRNPASVVNNPNAWLQESWNSFRDRFVQKDGRVLDFYLHNASTSEGQAYGMLRAVWLNDKEAFDRLWLWTRNNLQVRPQNNLFAWKWGPVKGKKAWGPQDDIAATDADQDIALALLMAQKRWNDYAYHTEALKIIKHIWRDEVVQTPAVGPVLMPGDWHAHKARKAGELLLLNPSYFAPYAYRVFAQVDKKHPWNEVAKSSYIVLQKSLNLGSTPIISDWLWLDPLSGQVSAINKMHPHPNKHSVYGYEAFRAPWRVLFDKSLFPKEAAKTPATGILSKALFTLNAWVNDNQELPGPLTLDGQEVEPLATLAPYGALWPWFKAHEPKLLLTLAKRYDFAQAVSTDKYYDQNWFWFGVMLEAVRQQGPVARDPLTAITYCVSLPSNLS
jgi:endoglucanase